LASPLLVIGSVNYDLIFRHPRLPRQGETITGAELFESCGGKGANQAVAAVRCRGALGDTAPPVLFGGAVGNDAHAASQQRVFEQDELDTRYLLVLDDCHTGLSVVWVEAATGDNRIMNSPGAGDAFNGAFAAALLATSGSHEAAAFGVRYASDSVTRHGTQTSFARW